MLLDRVKCAVPNPGAVAVGSPITLGAAPLGYRSFLTAFGAAAPCYFVLSDGAGRAITGVWTVNATSPETATITEILWNDRLASTAGETFAASCVAWNAIPAREALLMRTSPLAGFRNLIINGNPLINQRGWPSGSGTVIANQYTLDRWRIVSATQWASWTDSAGVRTVTAPAGGMEQVIEGIGLRGGVHALNWTGTATATINGVPVTKGGLVTLTGGADVTVRMTGGTWSMLQLEPGNQATPFEFRPVAAELALCMRYFERINYANTAVLGAIAVETNFAPPGGGMRIPFRVPKRTSPAVAISSAGHFALAGVSVASVGFGSDLSGAWGTFTGSSGSLAANWTSVSLISVSGSASISIEAEF